MRILIITAGYHPFIHPRAHRWTHIAEYWVSRGHEVHVVCARRRDYPDVSVVEGVRVHRAGFDSLKEVFYFLFGGRNGRGRVGALARKPNGLEQFFAWLYRSIWKKIYFPDDACLWYFPARRCVRRLLKKQSFDAVVSVSLPFTGHLLGWYAKRHYPQIHWLADIGDPFTIQPKPLNNAFLYGHISRRLERAILENADSVVVTNTGAVRAYREAFGPAADGIAVAPPLWTPWYPQPLHGQVSSKLGALNAAYFGALYAPVRTPDALLDLLKKTYAVQPDLLGRLRVHFFGDVFPEFFEKINQVPGVCMHGLRSREESAAAMQHVDILINIGNTTDYQLPSKIVDYLASGKPVVHLSFVERDPFVAFWGQTPGLLILPVRSDQVSLEDIPEWLAFLDLRNCHSGAEMRVERVQGCTVEAVAAVYEGLLFSEKTT